MSAYTRVFEEYRYDALGRRVLVRARRWCKKWPNEWFEGACRLSKIRRTVWDGEQALYEIQMPGEDGSPYLEADTAHVALGMFGAKPWPVSIDPNPFFGRVAYLHGAGLDRPLGIVRMGYGDVQDSAGFVLPHRALGPFLIVPLWNERGQPANGVFADGGIRKCEIEIIDGSEHTRCVFLSWPETWFAYVRPQVGRSFWHGSLLEDKQDASGTHYRRNRYYDPSTGRFTQEDPIGLAGGLNLYGFAGGDPVNFSDPFGLRAGCPSCTTMVSAAIADALTPDSGELESTWFDPVAFLAGGVAGGLRRLGARLLGSRIATETATVGELTLTHGRTLSRREMARLADDIAENGIREPIKFVRVGDGKFVVDGNHRLRIARQLGMENVPVEEVKLPFRGYRSIADLEYHQRP